MAWQFVYEGEVYKEDDLTLDQAEAIEDALTAKLREGNPTAPRATWSQIAPLRSAMHARIVMSHMVADRANLTIDVAAKSLGVLTANAIIEMFADLEDTMPTQYDQGNPPEAAGPSTDT